MISLNVGTLETTLDDIPKKDIVIIAGDWDAKIGSDNNGWQRVMGNFGYGDKNDRRERLLEFALEHDMMTVSYTHLTLPTNREV